MGEAVLGQAERAHGRGRAVGEADALERDAVAELFRSTDDAKVIIRWKDIHERLEEAVDALENAADVLEAIVVKNK